jgi:hypothetical protein
VVDGKGLLVRFLPNADVEVTSEITSVGASVSNCWYPEAAL